MGIRFGFVSIARRTLRNNQSSYSQKEKKKKRMENIKWATEMVVIKLSAAANVRLLIQSSTAKV